MRNFENSDISFFFSESNTQGKYTYASDNFIKIDGRCKDEIYEIFTKSIRDPEVPQYILDEMFDWPREKGYWDGVLKNIKKDGTTYWVRASIIKVHKNDGVYFGMVSIPATKEEIEKTKIEYNKLRTLKYDKIYGREHLRYPIFKEELDKITKDNK